MDINSGRTVIINNSNPVIYAPQPMGQQLNVTVNRPGVDVNLGMGGAYGMNNLDMGVGLNTNMGMGVNPNAGYGMNGNIGVGGSGNVNMGVGYAGPAKM
ncbi:unnamed protein product [Sphagnum balticum]